MTVSYVVDADGIIRGVGGGWDRFALDNGAPELAGDAVTGRPLAAFIAGSVTLFLMRALLARSRDGQVIDVATRCDAPAVRRYMTMRMTARAGGEVEVVNRVDREEPRARQALLDRSTPRAQVFVTMCGWCQKISASGEWVEIEEGVRRLTWLAAAEPPAITHGICPDCLARLRAEMS